MKKQLFVLKDRVVDTYIRPFTATNEIEAQRMLVVLLQSDDNHLHHHPDDFSLYHIGEFDQATGIINAFPEPEYIMNLAILKKFGINENGTYGGDDDE